MKKETSKKNSNESQILNLLKQVLPKATHDPKLAGDIYTAVEQELKTKTKEKAFSRFCSECALPGLEPENIEEVRRQLGVVFGQGDIAIKPDKKEKNISVEVTMPNGAQFRGVIGVGQTAPEVSDEQEVALKFVPFPVSLPGDKELVWILAKTENLNHEEAGIALAKLESDFWASKSGQKAIRQRVERSFAEFISRVPAVMLREAGLKRHYKTPEPVKVLQQLKG
jgi:hypothetical protein